MKILGFHNYAFLFDLCADEIREMIERVGSLRLKETALELEGTEDEFSKCRKSKIKYSRALLLQLTEVEVCRELPDDFDVLLLRQLDEGCDATVEHKSIIVTPFDHSPFLITPRNLASPGARWTNHLLAQSKESHSQRTCSSEKKEVWQPLLPKPEKYIGVLRCGIQKGDLFQLSKTEKPYRSQTQKPERDDGVLYNDIQKSDFFELSKAENPNRHQKPEKDGGVLHCEIQKSETFQLSKTENPYRPPHLNKKRPQPLPTFYEPGDESSGESVGKGPADDIAGAENSNCRFALEVSDDSTKEPAGKSEALGRANEGNHVIDSSKPLDEYEDFWRKSEGNVVIGGNKILEERMEDKQPTFDDFWAEILETIHLQQEPNISPTADSEVEIHFPDEESLTSVSPLQLPENLHSLNFEDSNSAVNSEGEINLPDEDSLISIHDMIAPCNSMPTLKSGSWEADKVSPNTAVDIRKYSKSANAAKRDANPKWIRPKAQPRPDFPGLVSHEQLHSPLPNHLLCDQTGFTPLFLTLNNLPYIPSVNNFSQADIRLPFCPETTYVMSQYSLTHQPSMLPQQPNHPVAVHELDAMQFLHSASQQTEIYNYNYDGLGKWKPGK